MCILLWCYVGGFCDKYDYVYIFVLVFFVGIEVVMVVLV